MRCLTYFVVLLVARLSLAQEIARPPPPVSTASGAAPAALSPPPPLVTQSPDSKSARRLTMVGLLVDAGVPHGAAASLVIRPFWFVRIDAGATYNYVNYGVRGGLTLYPFRFPIVPTLHLEGGHTFDGNANKLAAKFGSVGTTEAILLRQVSYDYACAQLGVEVGSQNRFVFFIRAGLAYVSTELRNFQEALRAKDSSTSIEIANPKVRFTLPSANLGFVLYLL